MNDPISLEEDGFIEVTVAGKPQKLDLYCVNNTLVNIQNSNPAPNDFHAAVAKYMEETLKYPKVSDRLALRFVEAIYAQMSNLQKKSGEEKKPESPASITSTPSD
jgi:hypothetical protein